RRRVGRGTTPPRRGFFAALFAAFAGFSGFGFFFFFGFVAGVFGAFGFVFEAFGFFHRAFEREDPEGFTVRRRRQRVATGVDGDFLFAFVFERGHRGVGPGAGLPAPEFFAVFDVERLEFAVVLADEDEATGGRHRARVTGFFEVVLPGDFAGAHVVGGQEARRVGPGGRDLVGPDVRFAFFVLL